MSNESASPDHYKGNVEAIDAIRSALGDEGFIHYLRGTIMRYVFRLGKKDDPVMEAAKIRVYARWMSETLDGKPLSKD